MAVPDKIGSPEWITNGARITGGLDLLGLRLPVQFVGGTLLNGITTVTPSIRYLAVRTWLLHEYGQSGRPDSWELFTDYALRIECALVLSTMAVDSSITGLIGSDQAYTRLEDETAEVSLAPLVKSPAATIYAGSSDQLGLTRARDDAVPALTSQRGAPLAKAMGARLAGMSVIERLRASSSPNVLDREDLDALGEAVRIDVIPDDERALLVQAIMPMHPLSDESRRICTYSALLALAKGLKRRPTETDFFKAACSKNKFGKSWLDPIADGWTAYAVRDCIAVTQEAVMAAVMRQINADSENGKRAVHSASVISGLVEGVDDHSVALHELGLLRIDESISDMPFNQLEERVEEAVSGGMTHSQGIARWESKLVEPVLYGLALNSGAGALSLALVAWILAGVRVGSAVEEDAEVAEQLSYRGNSRLGLREVIIPELRRFRRENRPIREIAAVLAYRTVRQHLQVAWSRFSLDMTHDVALLTSEGEYWRSRGKEFSAGRTASRIPQALGWLFQLQLIDQEGITADGNDLLDRCGTVVTSNQAT